MHIEVTLTGAAIAQFDDSASPADFRELAKRSDLRTLHCASPVSDDVWRNINEHFCAARPDVELRVYRLAPAELDLGFAQLLPNVRRFSVDNLGSARNVEALSGMPNLESLSLGIFEMQNLSVLDSIAPGLTELRLGATRSKKPSLAPLRRFGSLRKLQIDGHVKNIEVLSELSELADVTLRSITTPDLTFLAPLAKLASLDIKLGGIRNFKGIEEKRSIKHFELWQLRELHDIGIISALPGLQSLFLQSLPHVQVLPCMGGSPDLRRVVIENLKGLSDLSGLAAAPALEEFVLIDGRNQTPQQLVPVLEQPRLRRISAGFGSVRRNQEFELLREKYGKESIRMLTPFEFR